MKDAKEYAKLFMTGQYGKLYLVSGEHARGKTFRIFVLPECEIATPNGPNNPPLNKNAVEVYGVIGGNPGWTEYYGWLHFGPWQKDFADLVLRTTKEHAMKIKAQKMLKAAQDEKERQRIAGLLLNY